MNPERQAPPDDPLRLRVQLARIALVSTPVEELRYPEIDGVRYLDVLHNNPDGPIVGHLHIRYFPLKGLVKIHDVALYDEALRNQGLGVEMYRSVPFLPAPDGGIPQESDRKFISNKSASDDAKRVWKSLARQGLAYYVGRSQYQFRREAPAPDILDIEEF